MILQYPQAKLLVRRYYGTRDFLYNDVRYVLWIAEDQLALANSIPEIADRLQKVQRDRKKGGLHAKRAAAWPHRFAFIHHRDVEALVIPETTSERRQYLQLGLLSPSDIASHTLYVIYSAPLHLLALLSSRLHRIWAETVAGKLESRLRYSSGLAYNTFPIPKLSDEQQLVLAEHTKYILRARARHPGKAIAWLYDPETMPTSLLTAHQENDAYIENCIYGRAFKDDTHRLEHLFGMYSTMASREKLPFLATEGSPRAHRSNA